MSGIRVLSNRSRQGLLMAASLAAAFLIKPVQDRVDEHVKNRRPGSELLYFSTPAAVKRMALGYDSLIADVYWMRAIQYYGRREEASRRPVRYKNLAALLDIATTLDPKMLDAYRAGSGFLAEPDPIGAGQPNEAVRLLDKGIAQDPAEWRLRFDKGFIHFWYLKDFGRAGEVWFEASRLPSAPPWMPSLAAMAMSKSGAVETARALWQRQYQESDRADVRENAWNHLASIQVNEDQWSLEFFIEKYAKKSGKPPSKLEDLVRAGLLRTLPRDPSGAPYLFDPSAGTVRLGPASKVRYLKIPFDYKDAFREKLARLYGIP